MAQGEERPMKTTANATNIYIEFAGPSIVYSFNMMPALANMKMDWFSCGIGGASWDGDGFMSVPIQLNYLIETKGKYPGLEGVSMHQICICSITRIKLWHYNDRLS
jgi:hypothetical protein